MDSLAVRSTCSPCVERSWRDSTSRVQLWPGSEGGRCRDQAPFQRAQCHRQQWQLHRLDQVVVGAVAHALQLRVDAHVGGQHHDAHGGKGAVQAGNVGQHVAVRQGRAADQYLRGLAPDVVERVVQRAAGVHGMAEPGDMPGHGFGPFRGIFDDEDAHACSCPVRPRTASGGGTDGTRGVPP